MLDVMELIGRWDNYIYPLRKESGLSQKDLAFLIEDQRDRIHLYELRRELPSLRVGVACGLVFDEPIESVFAGVTDRMRKQIAANSAVLLQTMTDQVTDENALKLTTLDRLVHLDDDAVWRNST